MRSTIRAFRGFSLGVIFLLPAGVAATAHSGHGPARQAADPAAAVVQSAQSSTQSDESGGDFSTQPLAVEPRLPEGAVDSEAATDPTQGPQTETFQFPVHNGYRLNFCYLSAQDQCGQPTAETWCQEKGFARVASWSRDPHVGALFPTIIMGLDQICDEFLCDGFEEITCTQ